MRNPYIDQSRYSPTFIDRLPLHASAEAIERSAASLSIHLGKVSIELLVPKSFYDEEEGWLTDRGMITISDEEVDQVVLGGGRFMSHTEEEVQNLSGTEVYERYKELVFTPRNMPDPIHNIRAIDRRRYDKLLESDQ